MLVMVLERVAPDLEQEIRDALAEADRDRGSVPYDVLRALRAAQEDLDAIRVGRLPITPSRRRLGRVRARDRPARRSDRRRRPRARSTLLQKCTVEAIGAVAVTGKGMLESTLRVRGRLEVLGDGAIVRGGLLDLDGSAAIAELAPGAGDGLTVVLAPGSVLEAARDAAGRAGRAARRPTCSGWRRSRPTCGSWRTRSPPDRGQASVPSGLISTPCCTRRSRSRNWNVDQAPRRASNIR